jgi:8-oxo-dGTP diphosphatase
VKEELGLVLDPSAMRALSFADEGAVDGRPGIVLFLYDCPKWKGTPEAMEGQAFGWFTPAEADKLALASMDRTLLESLPR